VVPPQSTFRPRSKSLKPTRIYHPQDDERHHVCNVCRTKFTCPPPTRHELMESFTGPELASLLSVGCVIGAHTAFSKELESQFAGMPPFVRARSSYDHWMFGVYLITGVEKDGDENDRLSYPAEDDRTLDALREHLNKDKNSVGASGAAEQQQEEKDGGQGIILTLQSRQLRVVPGGSLKDVTEENLATALAELSAPAEIVFAPICPDVGEDHILAVNITRPLSAPPGVAARMECQAAIGSVTARYPDASKVVVTHYNGGPCEDEAVQKIVVPGGGGRGWTLLGPDLAAAVKLAYARSLRRHEAQGDIGGGTTVRLTGLVARPDLNGEIGISLRFNDETGRWTVRLRNGEGKNIKTSNLEPVEGADGRVLVFWGDARWSRAQLLGEIARGHWCVWDVEYETTDVLRLPPAVRHSPCAAHHLPTTTTPHSPSPTGACARPVSLI